MAANGSEEEFPDFSVRTKHADFKLIVDGRTLFINAHAVAELSPVFDAMFFNEGYNEGKERGAEIKEDKYEEILEMLRCLLPCSSINKKPKPISGRFRKFLSFMSIIHNSSANTLRDLEIHV